MKLGQSLRPGELQSIADLVYILIFFSVWKCLKPKFTEIHPPAMVQSFAFWVGNELHWFSGSFFWTFKFLSKKGPWILETNWMPGSSPSLAANFGGENYRSLTEFIAGEQKSAESAHSSVRVSCRWPSHERDFNFFATCAMHFLFEDTQVWPIPWTIYAHYLSMMMNCGSCIHNCLKEVTKVVNSRRDK